MSDKLRWKLPLEGSGPSGNYIFDADSHMVAEIRGWGHLTGQGGLRLDGDTAAAVQTARQAEIIRRVNAHDALVAALQQAERAFRVPAGENPKAEVDALGAMRKALADAGAAV